MQGAQDRQLARLLQLVPLLLSGPVSRADLPLRLGDRLELAGLEGLLVRRPGEDPAAVLDRDLRRLKRLGLLAVGKGKGRVYEASPGPATSLWVSPAEAQALRLAQAVLEQLGLPESVQLKGLLARLDGALRSNMRPSSQSTSWPPCLNTRPR